MTEAQQQLLARMLADPRVRVHETQNLVAPYPEPVGEVRVEVRMEVEVCHPAGVRSSILTVYACDPIPRMVHYEYSIPKLGGSRSDVLAYLAGSLPSWKREKFYEILNS